MNRTEPSAGERAMCERLEPRFRALLRHLSGVEHAPNCRSNRALQQIAVEAYEKGVDDDDLLVGIAALRLMQMSQRGYGVMIGGLLLIYVRAAPPTLSAEDLNSVVLFLLREFRQARTMAEYEAQLTDIDGRWASMEATRKA